MAALLLANSVSETLEFCSASDLSATPSATRLMYSETALASVGVAKFHLPLAYSGLPFCSPSRNAQWAASEALAPSMATP